MIYSIKGTVVDGQSLTPIKGAKISISSTLSTFTDKNGKFEITWEEQFTSQINLNIGSLNFQNLTIIPYTGDNTLKNDLGVISLQPLSQSLNEDKLSSSQLTKSQIKELTKSKKDASYYIEERLLNQVNNIKNTLIPSVITMVSVFGITKIQNITSTEIPKVLDQSYCPSQPELVNLINQKNKLVKQLNNSLNIIDTTTKSIGITGGIIETLNITYNILKFLPLPIAPGTPTSIILAIQDNKENLNTLIDKLKYINLGTLSILILLRQVLTQAIQILNLLDGLIQKCYPDGEQEKIAIELTILTQQQSNQLSPVVTNVNGFEMGVETEVTDKPLKRRRAIARNKGGVVMLQGEWSYSSIDQILIDELVFYIQQNNLKAE
jgi:hypothetical protein